MLHSILCLLTVLHLLSSSVCPAGPPFEIEQTPRFSIELPESSIPGEASIREHSIVWHPARQKYYLIGDVIPTDSPHHPNTYDTQLHLWSSPTLEQWTYHGVAVEKGDPATSYDGYGVASPAGMTVCDGRLLVPFSARRTSRFAERSIGVAASEANPEALPWTKTGTPVSDLPGEDDDPALFADTHGSYVHLYHRVAGPDGYQIVHTTSSTPLVPDSWPAAQVVATRPKSVRAQELTGVYATDQNVFLLIIEHLVTGGAKIAYVKSDSPLGPFTAVVPGQRYLPQRSQPKRLAHSGHISPVVRNGSLVAFSWTVPQTGQRYGVEGYRVHKRAETFAK